MRCTKFILLLFAATALSTAVAIFAQDPDVHVYGSLMDGPVQPQDFAKWLTDMKRWRHEQRVRIGYDGSEYDRPALKWTQSSFMQPQMMVEDRYFYDSVGVDIRSIATSMISISDMAASTRC
jgi:hypothetical protein